MVAQPGFRKTVDGLVQATRQAAEAPAWFQKNHLDSPLGPPDRFDVNYGMADNRISVVRLDVPDVQSPEAIAYPPKAKV